MKNPIAIPMASVPMAIPAIFPLDIEILFSQS
jgi:hypothetical protein